MSYATFESSLLITAPSEARGHRASAAGVSVLLHVALVSALFLAPLTRLPEEPEVAASFRTALTPPAVAPPIPEATPVARGTRRPAQGRPAQAQAFTPAHDVSRDALVVFTDPLPATDPVDRDRIGDFITRDDGGTPCIPGAVCASLAIPGDGEARHETPRVGGLIAEPRLLEGRPPVYPPVALAARVSGSVVVEAHVLQDGRVQEARILKSHALFDEAALESVRSRRYEPLRLNGVPTDFLITITVTFTLRR